MTSRTAFSDTASDSLSRLNMRKEGLFDLIVEKESDLKEGPYRGFIIEAESIGNGRLKAYIRIPKIHDFILPNPCNEKYTEQQNKALKSMLVTAISRTDTYNENSSEDVVSYRGQLVEIVFTDGSPKQGGKMRGAVIKFISSNIVGSTEGAEKDGQFCYMAGNENQLSLTSNIDFNGLKSDYLADKRAPPASSVTISKSTALKIEAFIELLKNSGYFKDFTPESVCGMIANAQHESKFRTTIGGDPPSHWLKVRKKHAINSPAYKKATKRYNRIVKHAVIGHGYAKDPQYYCSWGYWQLQICTSDGAGREAATRAGIDTKTEKGKEAWANWVKDPNNQFEYLDFKLRKMGLHNLKDAEKAGTKICTDFERPSGSQASFDAVHKTGKKKGQKVNKCPQRGLTSLAIWKKYESKIREVVAPASSKNYLPTAEEITKAALGTE